MKKAKKSVVRIAMDVNVSVSGVVWKILTRSTSTLLSKIFVKLSPFHTKITQNDQFNRPSTKMPIHSKLAKNIFVFQLYTCVATEMLSLKESQVNRDLNPGRSFISFAGLFCFYIYICGLLVLVCVNIQHENHICYTRTFKLYFAHAKITLVVIESIFTKLKSTHMLNNNHS